MPALAYWGQIVMFAGNFAPRGWALCDGQRLSIAQNTALFSLLGTTYGGDGIRTFALPDLRGRIPMHSGAGPGLSPRDQGSTGGTETATLTAAQMPVHAHPVAGETAAVLPTTAGAQVGFFGTDAALGTEISAVTGGSQPHQNLMPFQAVNFIICLQGIFPSRS